MLLAVADIMSVIFLLLWAYILIGGSVMGGVYVWQRSRLFAAFAIVLMLFTWNIMLYDPDPYSWHKIDSNKVVVPKWSWYPERDIADYRRLNQYVVDLYIENHNCHFELLDFCWFAPEWNIPMEYWH